MLCLSFLSAMLSNHIELVGNTHIHYTVTFTILRGPQRRAKLSHYELTAQKKTILVRIFVMASKKGVMREMVGLTVEG